MKKYSTQAKPAKPFIGPEDGFSPSLTAKRQIKAIYGP
jgi:hypothetical protein